MKWVKKIGLREEGEVDIDELNNNLVVSAEGGQEEAKRIAVDLSELDRSTYEKIITALYVSGYDEIEFTSSSPELPDLKLKKDFPLRKVVNLYINRFVGFEIVSQTENKIVVKSVSKESPEEFDTILRRIFFLILEFQEVLLASLDKKNSNLHEMGYESYDHIYKFRNYAERLLMKDGKMSLEEQKNYVALLNGLQEINHHTRFCCEDVALLKSVSAPSDEIIRSVVKMVRLFYELAYTFDFRTLQKIIAVRFEVREKLRKTKAKQSELVLLSRFTPIVDSINLLTINIVGLHYAAN
tara:strand:- start:7 stop:897 length:891 start_codon:yes stop_codon:yes gene_type:complete